MIRSSLRIALVALALATVGGTTQASAGFFGPHFGPHFGPVFVRPAFGFRPRFAFGGPFVRFPVCGVRRFVNFEGDLVIRRVCF